MLSETLASTLALDGAQLSLPEHREASCLLAETVTQRSRDYPLSSSFPAAPPAPARGESDCRKAIALHREREGGVKHTN